jgi:hypothetical protein
MVQRILGIALLVAATALGFATFRALSDVDSQARTMAQVGQAMGRPVDPTLWAERWRAIRIGGGVFAAFGIVAGVGFMLRHRLAPLALAMALTARAVWLVAIRMRGPRLYAFEASSSDIVESVCAAVACIWVAWRWQRR